MNRLQNKQYMVFSGGGILGVSHIGVVAYVKNMIGLHHFLGFAGTSIGAFLAMILACGEQNPQQMFYWMTNPEFFLQLVNSIHLPQIGKTYGVIPCKIGLTYIEKILESYFPGASHWSFLQLYERTGKSLCVATTNLSFSRVEYHSHYNTPSFNVAKSVYASMCVPFMCAPMEINGSFFVDGGILDNFPIIHSGFPLQKTIGSYLDTPCQMNAILKSRPSMKTWMQYALEILYMMCRMSSNAFFPRHLLEKTDIVMIPPVKDVHFLKLWANTDELFSLYVQGAMSAKKHFS
jgi:predicted acylesterase/phospholipase RssA